MATFSAFAVCDVVPANAEKVATAHGVKPYADYRAMLAAEKPEVVVICTANDTHAPMTIEAARAGARGVYCEKPMAMDMAGARAMVQACHECGAVLVVNHQRRLGPDLAHMRRMIESGALGEIRLIRAQCQGDILSDGTHAIDSVQWMTGDRPVRWILGQIHRDIEALSKRAKESKRPPAQPGFRYGHPVETGGMAVLQIDGGPRVELFFGDMVEERLHYQTWEVLGSRGRLLRTGDSARPNLFISDAEGGGWRAGRDDWAYKPVPMKNDGAEGGGRGEWRPVAFPPDDGINLIAKSYALFARSIRAGAPHPMSGEVALRGFEVVMGIYESARLRRKIALPLQQDRFPLQLMLDSGQL